MTTVAQVKSWCGRSCNAIPTLHWSGAWWSSSPYIISCAASILAKLRSQTFVPTWAAIFLFEPNDSFHFIWGERVYDEASGISDVPDLPKRCADAIEERRFRYCSDQGHRHSIDFTSKDRFPTAHGCTSTTNLMSTSLSATSRRHSRCAIFLHQTQSGRYRHSTWTKSTIASRKNYAPLSRRTIELASRGSSQARGRQSVRSHEARKVLGADAISDRDEILKRVRSSASR